MLYNLQNPLNLSGKTHLLSSASVVWALPHYHPMIPFFPSKTAIVPLCGQAIIQQGPLDLLHCKYKLCLYDSKVIANLLVGTWQ